MSYYDIVEARAAEAELAHETRRLEDIQRDIIQQYMSNEGKGDLMFTKDEEGIWREGQWELLEMPARDHRMVLYLYPSKKRGEVLIYPVNPDQMPNNVDAVHMFNHYRKVLQGHADSGLGIHVRCNEHFVRGYQMRYKGVWNNDHELCFKVAITMTREKYEEHRDNPVRIPFEMVKITSGPFHSVRAYEKKDIMLLFTKGGPDGACVLNQALACTGFGKRMDENNGKMLARVLLHLMKKAKETKNAKVRVRPMRILHADSDFCVFEMPREGGGSFVTVYNVMYRDNQDRKDRMNMRKMRLAKIRGGADNGEEKLAKEPTGGKGEEEEKGLPPEPNGTVQAGARMSPTTKRAAGVQPPPRVAGDMPPPGKDSFKSSTVARQGRVAQAPKQVKRVRKHMRDTENEERRILQAMYEQRIMEAAAGNIGYGGMGSVWGTHGGD